jgi:hypothetical protein
VCWLAPFRKLRFRGNVRDRASLHLTEIHVSPYVEQVARALGLRDHGLAARVDAALMRAYWQGWDDGVTERGKIAPSGAAGRGVLAALGELRGVRTPADTSDHTEEK